MRAVMNASTPATDKVAGIAVGDSPLRVWGLPPAMRLRRQFARAGAATDPSLATRFVLVSAQWVVDEAIIRGLARQSGEVVLVHDGKCVGMSVSAARRDEAQAALAQNRPLPEQLVLSLGELADGFNDTLRKREPPLLMELSAQALPTIERRVFGASYKGVTDLVTLYVWPAPARAVTKLCALAGITPNQVTTASLLLVLLTMWLFWHGHYGWGLLAAWPMTFLDTVDGKLARVTVQSSPWGNVFDHGIDLIHPPFWWWAWIVGLPAAGFAFAGAHWALWVILAGYILQRVEEGLFMALFKMDMHIWQRFDSFFRLITARRNPNLLILNAAVLLGRPDAGIAVVAVWVAICLLVHAVRLLQAAQARRKGPLTSWLSRPA